MLIRRSGAFRNRGTETLVNFDPSARNYFDQVRWNEQNKCVEFTSEYVRAGSSRTKHNYRVDISLKDITLLIAILARAGSATDPELLQEHLKDQIPALVKLLACATGIVPTPMREPATNGHAGDAPVRISAVARAK